MERLDKYFITLIYGENIGMKDDIKNQIKKLFKHYEKIIFTQDEISKEVSKSVSTISVSLKSLQRNNIIERVIMNKNSKISSDIGFKILDGKKSANNLVKYNL